MAAVMISDATLRDFVESSAGHFEVAVEALFKELDGDGDGLLSQSDLSRGLEGLGMLVKKNNRASPTCKKTEESSSNSMDSCSSPQRNDGNRASSVAGSVAADVEYSPMATRPGASGVVSSDGPPLFFQIFHPDDHGLVNPAEFKSQMRDIVLAIAYHLRGCPIPMLLNHHSLLAYAVKLEQQNNKALAT